VNVRRTKADRNREARTGVRRPPSHEEADRICMEFPAIKALSCEDCQDYAMIARYTGMRQGEIAQLLGTDAVLFPTDAYLDAILPTPDQFQRPYVPADGGPEGMVLCLYVRDRGSRSTKTGLERIVPVAAKLLPVLRRRLDRAGGKAFFASALPDRGSIFGRAWLRGVKKIHAELTMHGFRHYAASEMENNGVNATVSGAILDHVDSSVHGGYVHVEIGTLKEAVDTIW